MKCARGDGRDATHHVFWNEWRDGALVCDEHTQQAYRYTIHDIHNVTEKCVDECPMGPFPADPTPGRVMQQIENPAGKTPPGQVKKAAK